MVLQAGNIPEVVKRRVSTSAAFTPDLRSAYNFDRHQGVHGYSEFGKLSMMAFNPCSVT